MTVSVSGSEDLSFDDLLSALRQLSGLTQVGDPANPHFRFRDQEFAHFHKDGDRIHADVRFGHGLIRGLPASTPTERAELLARIRRHVSRIYGSRKLGRQDKRPGPPG